MKAIRVRDFGGSEGMKLEDGPDAMAAAGQAPGRVHAIGVNPYEAYIRAGTYAIKPALPYTPGKDAAGVVAAVGDGVTSVKPGDRVYMIETVTGAYAQLAVCEARHLFPLPENVSS